MTGDRGDLIGSLVDLAEAFNSFNLELRREAERRTGQPLLTIEEAALLVHIIGNPDGAVVTMAAAMESRPAVLARSAQVLQRRGLITVTPDEDGGRAGRLRATELGIGVRNTARERCAQQLRYAIAGIGAADRAELERAVGALGALGAGLGFQGLHHSYRS